MSVGNRIKNIRLELGDTMEEFGSRFDTSKGTINNWEKERNKPNKNNLKAIAELGNTTVEELLYEDNQNKQVGKRIKNIRQAKGFSQSEFGERLDNAHKSLVSKWERGENLPNNERLKAIAELGNITVEELLYGDTYFKKLDMVKQKIHEAYEHINDVLESLSEIEEIIGTEIKEEYFR